MQWNKKIRLQRQILSILLAAAFFCSDMISIRASRSVRGDGLWMDPKAASAGGWNLDLNRFEENGVPLASERTDLRTLSRWMDYGNDDYTFELTASEDTCFYPFIEPDPPDLQGKSDEELRALYGEGEDCWYNAYPVTSIVHEEEVPIYSGVALLPTREGGFYHNCGVWIRNFGVYQGRRVDCKCTLIYEYLYSGDRSGVSENTADLEKVYPVILLYARKDGTFGVDGSDMNYEIRFQLYDHESVNDVFTVADAEKEPGADKLGSVVINRKPGEKLPVRLCLGIGDIDEGQSVAVWGRNGDDQLLEVSGNSELYCVPSAFTQASQPETTRLVGYSYYHWAGSGRDSHWNDAAGRTAAGEFRVYLADCSDFDIFFAGWLGINKTGMKDNRYRIGEDSYTQSFEDCYARYQAAVRQIREEGRYDPSAFPVSESGMGTHSLCRGASYYLGACSFSQRTLPEPSMSIRTVGQEETEGSCMVFGPEEELVCHMKQCIPEEREALWYESFTLTWPLPEGMTCRPSEIVITDTEGNAAGEEFECVLEEGALVIRARQEGDGGVHRESFYGRTYCFDIPCGLSAEAEGWQESRILSNHGTACAVTQYQGEQGVQTADTGTDTGEAGAAASVLFICRNDQILPQITIHVSTEDGLPAAEDLVQLYRIAPADGSGPLFSTLVRIPAGSTEAETYVMVEGGYGTAALDYVIEPVPSIQTRTQAVSGQNVTAQKELDLSGLFSSAVVPERCVVTVAFETEPVRSSLCRGAASVVNAIN